MHATLRMALFGGPKRSGSGPQALGASLRGWWTADRADLIALSGAQVTGWKDVVAGYDAVQAVAGSRPLYSATGFNGAPGLTFDGIDDELTLASQPFPSGATGSELWVVVQQDALPADTATRRSISYGGVTLNDNRENRRATLAGVNKATAGCGSSIGSVAPGAVTGDDFSGRHVHRVVYGPTDVTQNINGVAGVAAAAVPTTGAARVTIGRSTTGSGPWNGKLRDIVVTDLLTPDQAAAMLAWAMPRRML